MIRVKKYMLLYEDDSEVMISKYRLRKINENYTGGCPQRYCSPSLCKIYNGCEEGLDCEDCWDRFLDNIIITKRSNMEVYYE